MNDQLWRCPECGWRGVGSAMLTAPSPFNADDTLTGCPRCKAVSEFINVCDEPSCRKDASCGWPTIAGGYRRACGGHLR